jgi:hypothetical protein
MRPAALYHYTCRHAAQRVTARGFLIPIPQPALRGVALIWLTDLMVPDREGLGLTSHHLDCDRLEYRYVAIDPDVVSWEAFKRSFPFVPFDFELGRLPAHWYVARRPVFVTRDRGYRHEGSGR